MRRARVLFKMALRHQNRHLPEWRFWRLMLLKRQTKRSEFSLGALWGLICVVIRLRLGCHRFRHYFLQLHRYLFLYHQCCCFPFLSLSFSLLLLPSHLFYLRVLPLRVLPLPALPLPEVLNFPAHRLSLQYQISQLCNQYECTFLLHQTHDQ